MLHRGALGTTSRALFSASPGHKQRCSIVALGAPAHRPGKGRDVCAFSALVDGPCRCGYGTATLFSVAAAAAAAVLLTASVGCGGMWAKPRGDTAGSGMDRPPPPRMDHRDGCSADQARPFPRRVGAPDLYLSVISSRAAPRGMARHAPRPSLVQLVPRWASRPVPAECEAHAVLFFDSRRGVPRRRQPHQFKTLPVSRGCRRSDAPSWGGRRRGNVLKVPYSCWGCAFFSVFGCLSTPIC